MLMHFLPKKEKYYGIQILSAICIILSNLWGALNFKLLAVFENPKQENSTNRYG